MCIFLQFIHRHYKGVAIEHALDQATEFEGDSIKLDIPMNGVTTGEWLITPQNRPEV